MTTFQLFCLAGCGWGAAAFLALGLYGCRQNKAGWRKLCGEKDEIIRDLERQRLVGVKADPDGLKWYREENQRLTRKCHAICASIRKVKGRGRVTMQLGRTHNF